MHVDKARKEYGLPFGGDPHSVDKTNSTISPPSTLDKPAKSFPIYTTKFSEFYSMSAKDLQAIFRVHPVIVLSDHPTHLKCDLNSLEEWGNLDDLRVMHGKLS